MREGKILWWSDVVCSIQRHVLHPPTSLSLTDLSPQSPQSKDRLTISQSHNLKIGLQSHNLQSKDRLTTLQSHNLQYKDRLTTTQSHNSQSKDRLTTSQSHNSQYKNRLTTQYLKIKELSIDRDIKY